MSKYTVNISLLGYFFFRLHCQSKYPGGHLMQFYGNSTRQKILDNVSC